MTARRTHASPVAVLRRALAADPPSGPWRGPDELAASPRFRRWLEGEFPEAASAGACEVDRRRFLSALAASLALAGATGCRQRGLVEPIVPRVRLPEDRVPGRPQRFATALTRDGWALGVVVECHGGRPTLVEGNPDHPASGGATDVFAQADVLSLYDPDRSAAAVEGTQESSWEALSVAVAERLRQTGGRGLRVLTGNVTSATLLGRIGAMLERYPDARWHRWDPIGDGAARAGAEIAFGRPLRVVPRASGARVVLVLDDDPFHAPGDGVRLARELTRPRRIRFGSAESGDMNRLWVVEPTPTLTGATADVRLAVRRQSVGAVARAVGVRLGVLPGPEPELPDAARRFVAGAARDLAAHRGRSLVLVGEGQPPWVHALGHLLAGWAGGDGAGLDLYEPVAGPLDGLASDLRSLVADVARGRVETLLVAGVDPAYAAPPELEVADAIGEVPFSVHLGMRRDETGQRCRWHVPMAHELECWGDATARDGTATVQQPMIEPLLGGRSLLELLGVVLGEAGRGPRDLVRETWRGRLGPPFEAAWEAALRTGLVAGSEASPLQPSLHGDAVRAAVDAGAHGAPAGGLELVLTPDPRVWDGRWADNGWLQELPKPIEMTTWTNAALLSPATAADLGVGDGDQVAVEAGGRSVELPACVVPGQAEGVVAVRLGYGRTGAGAVGAGLGANGYRLTGVASRWARDDAGLARTGMTAPLNRTQDHHAIEGRHMLRGGTVEQLRRDPAAVAHPHGPPGELPTLYGLEPPADRQWGMAIDLATCIGCGVCTIACQAENSIPVVGPEQVRRGREMHWMRVDRYFEGPVDDPRIRHQPVPCMHCERAPCEPVCPTGATQHSSDGLNEMVYNRCIGTRYCSNNCPYKVRRFNFFRYVDADSELPALQRNPDVTVRGRGVMEKCTYCVQRIREAEIRARVDDRELVDGDVVTACQAACPTGAIVFGDVADPDSAVSAAKAEPHGYAVLGELNTRPRTSYLAAVRNPPDDDGEPVG